MNRLRTFLLTALVVVMAMPAVSRAGMRETLLSAAVPGLGQLYGGSKAKGLGFMGAQILTLHLYFDNVSVYNSLCRDTELISDEMAVEREQSHKDLAILHAEWEDAFDRSEERKSLIMPLLGASLAVWALNIVDVIVFPPHTATKETLPDGVEGSPEGEDQSMGSRLEYNLVHKNDAPHVMVTYTF